MKNYLSSGFTFPELIVVIAILATLFAFSFVNLNGLQRRAYVESALTTFVSDVKQQQVKAMVGDSEGRGVHDMYGIYLQTTSYTLFHGLNYSAADTSNFVVSLDNNIQLTNITFPESKIVFSSGNGELVNYTSGSNTVTLKNTVSGEQKTVTINRYGVITSIN